MIVFRQTDARYPFLWESPAQPAGRWHGGGEGPAHYFADTPDGAWAEFLRHEEITDVDDLRTIRRQIWAVDIGDADTVRVSLPSPVLTGDRDSYPRCQAEARRLRAAGAHRISAPSAALTRGGARAFVVRDGINSPELHDGTVIVDFGPTSALIGWIAAEDARPPVELLSRVRHFRSA